jgi:acetyl esterase/lipase
LKPGRAFLAATALGAVNTANAYRPVRRGRGAVLSFASGQFTSELPLHALAWQTAATAAFIQRGCLRSRSGRAGVVLAAASWAGLLNLHKEAKRSRDILEDALEKTLGPDYRKRMSGPSATGEASGDAPLTRRQVAFPVRGRRRRYAGVSDVAYASHGRRNYLDIWRRPGLAAGASAPVLIQVHGGAWTVGSKRGQAYPLLTRLAERGWVCVAINYRLAPRSAWPDQIVDVLHAVGWVRANIASYGGDPKFIAITGGSAGGHLSALAALVAGEPEFQPDFEDVDTTVQAAVPFYGIYDFGAFGEPGMGDAERFLGRVLFRSRLADDRPRWEQASPISQVRPDAPPFFVIHGSNDSLAPVEQARRFVERLRGQSENPVVFAELPRAQHAFDIYSSIRTAHTVAAVERFLDVVYAERVSQPDALTAAP